MNDAQIKPLNRPIEDQAKITAEAKSIKQKFEDELLARFRPKESIQDIKAPKINPLKASQAIINSMPKTNILKSAPIEQLKKDQLQQALLKKANEPKPENDHEMLELSDDSEINVVLDYDDDEKLLFRDQIEAGTYGPPRKSLISVDKTDSNDVCEINEEDMAKVLESSSTESKTP